MTIQHLSGGQQAKDLTARHALQAWLFISVSVLAPLRASGQATFSEGQPIEAPPLRALAITDLDGDGDPDLVAITTDALVWIENDGTGQFAAAQTLLADLPPEVRTLKTADLDGDGVLDLLLGNDMLFGSSGLFWAANEDGQFSALEVIEPVESGPFIAVDFDGDGDLDVLQGGLYVGLYENTGAGGGDRFRRAQALAPGPAGRLTAADFDSDGDADLVFSHRSFERNNDMVFHFEQREPGSLRLDFRRELMSYTREVPMWDRLISVMETADINGDGKIDVVLGAYINSDVGPDEGQVQWYKNSSFRDIPVFTSGGAIAFQERGVSDIWGPEALTIGDLDGDGDHDVAFAKASHRPHTLVWYENPGDEADPGTTWPEQVVGVGTGTIGALLAADIDLDGDIDLVTRQGREPHIVWYENLGSTGTATEALQGDAALVPESLRLEAVWPNPSAGVVTVAYQVSMARKIRLEVFDVLGRLIVTYEEHPPRAGSYRAELDLSTLARGTYMLRIHAGKDREVTGHFVLQ